MTPILRYLTFAIVATLWTSATAHAQQPGKLTADVRLSSRSIFWEDPLYVAIKLTNTTDKPIVLPAKARLLTINCKMQITIPDSAFSFPVESGLCTGMAIERERNLAPGDSIGDIKVIDVPDEDSRYNYFWHQLAQAKAFNVEVELPGDLVANNETKIEVQLRQRPQQEKALFERLKSMADSYKRTRLNLFESEVLTWHPYPTLRHLAQPISDNRLLVDEFIDHRGQISKGSLKNMLIMVHRLRGIADREGNLSETQRQTQSDALLKWLNGLNPIESKYLADRYHVGFTGRISRDDRLRKGDLVLTELDKRLVQMTREELHSNSN